MKIATKSSIKCFKHCKKDLILNLMLKVPIKELILIFCLFAIWCFFFVIQEVKIFKFKEKINGTTFN